VLDVGDEAVISKPAWFCHGLSRLELPSIPPAFNDAAGTARDAQCLLLGSKFIKNDQFTGKCRFPLRKKEYFALMRVKAGAAAPRFRIATF